jgi:hypothetical protein
MPGVCPRRLDGRETRVFALPMTLHDVLERDDPVVHRSAGSAKQVMLRPS